MLANSDLSHPVNIALLVIPYLSLVATAVWSWRRRDRSR